MVKVNITLLPRMSMESMLTTNSWESSSRLLAQRTDAVSWELWMTVVKMAMGLQSYIYAEFNYT
jgi:hypothetical protein